MLIYRSASPAPTIDLLLLLPLLFVFHSSTHDDTLSHFSDPPLSLSNLSLSLSLTLLDTYPIINPILWIHHHHQQQTADKQDSDRDRSSLFIRLLARATATPTIMLATLRRLTLTALRSPHKPCTLPLLPMYRYSHRTVATSAATSTITATSQPRRKATNSPGLRRSRSTSSAPRTPRRAPSSASASATTSTPSSKLHTRSRAALSQAREPEPYEQDEGHDDDDDDDEIIVAEQEPSATTERQPRDPSTLPKLEPGTRRWTVRAYDSSIRLDRFVRRALPELGLSLVYQLVRSRKQVTVVPNQQSSTPESLALLASRDRGQYRLQTGDVVTIEISEAQSRKANELAAAPVSGVRSRVCASSPKVLELKRSLVYEDSHLMIFNKPPGLAVQGKSNSIDVVSMLPFLGPDPEHPPKLVHRLDRDTSGLLVLAKTKLAAARMGELLRSRDSVEKRYLAILTRVPLPKCVGTCHMLLVMPLTHSLTHFMVAGKDESRWLLANARIPMATRWLWHSNQTRRTASRVPPSMRLSDSLAAMCVPYAAVTHAWRCILIGILSTGVGTTCSRNWPNSPTTRTLCHGSQGTDPGRLQVWRSSATRIARYARTQVVDRTADVPPLVLAVVPTPVRQEASERQGSAPAAHEDRAQGAGPLVRAIVLVLAVVNRSQAR